MCVKRCICYSSSDYESSVTHLSSQYVSLLLFVCSGSACETSINQITCWYVSDLFLYMYIHVYLFYFYHFEQTNIYSSLSTWELIWLSRWNDCLHPQRLLEPWKPFPPSHVLNCSVVCSTYSERKSRSLRTDWSMESRLCQVRFQFQNIRNKGLFEWVRVKY
jgi:hypothetical protein